MADKTHYEVLGVEPTASAKEIAAARRRLVNKYHPDKVDNLAPEFQELANKLMKEINAAYDELKDPQKRADYDKWLAQQHQAEEDQWRAQEEQRQQRAEEEQRRQEEERRRRQQQQAEEERRRREAEAQHRRQEERRRETQRQEEEAQRWQKQTEIKRVPKDIRTAIVLLVLCGWFGAHRLYLNMWGSAFAQLILFCISIFILALLATTSSPFVSVKIGSILLHIFPLAVFGVWLLVDLFLIPGMVRKANQKATDC